MLLPEYAVYCLGINLLLVNQSKLSPSRKDQLLKVLNRMVISSLMPILCSRSSVTFLHACSTVVWSRPPKASPISGKLWISEFLGERHGDLPGSGD